MVGDKSKPINSFSRWVEHSNDGLIRLRRVPSGHHNKRYGKRWKRRFLKKEIKEDLENESTFHDRTDRDI